MVDGVAVRGASNRGGSPPDFIHLLRELLNNPVYRKWIRWLGEGHACRLACFVPRCQASTWEPSLARG